MILPVYMEGAARSRLRPVPDQGEVARSAKWCYTPGMSTGNSITATDGLRLYLRSWAPAGDVRAKVVLIHGLGEHGGRYGHLAGALNGRGLALIACDLRGHGRSDGRRGHFPAYSLIMDDIGMMLDHAEKAFPGLPAFLYGHSMGGNLVINYALRRKPALAGVIASAPLFRYAEKPPLWKRIAGEVMLRLYPRVSMSNGIPSGALSRDPDVVEAYDSDPLVHDRVTPSFLNISRAGEFALANAGQWHLPLLLMHGDSDRVTSHEASMEFARKAGSSVDLKIWSGFFHEIHNEPEKQEVIDLIAEWTGRIGESFRNIGRV
ncbi:MAG TPA: lysophospholipase [Candidatus Krumholzibacterium sp.]|nr:lysophospholipase [Candidatus Krumholzibacterium sp.]